MIGLVDCNNFFVSCERVFRPELQGRPVIVLSNNDGCVVAMSEEAKRLGIKRGVPVYRVREIVARNNVTTLSGNHRLYSDMSSRVMATISSVVPGMEISSVDEAYLDLSHLPSDPESIAEFGRSLAHKVRRDTGIPVSIGISSTKTLAKVAARFAKKYPGYRGACVIDSDDKVRKALALLQAADVWGIGRKLARRLADIGITTAIQFYDMAERDIKTRFHVTTLRTWMELHGIPCVTSDSDTSDIQKQMCATRSFAGAGLQDCDSMVEAMAAFASSLCRKLRRMRCHAASISVFIHTNSFNNDLPQYYNSAHRTLDEPTNDTLTVTTAAIDAVRSIYRKGFSYKKGGLIITEIVRDDHMQLALFTSSDDREKRARLMSAVDRINSSPLTGDSVHVATHRPISSFLRQDHMSGHYTTDINSVITINCNGK
ncbi:MAG: Y-family DNA polymerase [Pseudoflavonifractor sp.]|nr:Y-family DNA polymerase [Pseudoflavonifractor sp.]